MIGRRIQHVPGTDPYTELEQPGDYLLALDEPYAYQGRPSVWFIVPVPLQPPIEDDNPTVQKLKRVAMCASPPHTFRECADGSLEIRASLLVTQRWAGTERTWHGFLDEGHVWRTA